MDFIPVFECVEDEVFEELLIADPHLDRLAGRTVLAVPGLYQGNVQVTSCAAGPKVEGARGP